MQAELLESNVQSLTTVERMKQVTYILIVRLIADIVVTMHLSFTLIISLNATVNSRLQFTLRSI